MCACRSGWYKTAQAGHGSGAECASVWSSRKVSWCWREEEVGKAPRLARCTAAHVLAVSGAVVGVTALYLPSVRCRRGQPTVAPRTQKRALQQAPVVPKVSVVQRCAQGCRYPPQLWHTLPRGSRH